MAKDDIVLHPEFGLNPALAVCQYCGKETGEIVFLGNSSKEQHKHVFINADPCDDCKKIFEQGVAFIEVEETGNENCPRVLKYAVITPDAAKVILEGYDHLDIVLEKHMVLVPKGFLGDIVDD